MFNPLKWKIWAGVGAIMLIMWTYIKKLLADRAKLQHDAKINDEIKSIHEQQEIDEREVLDNEPKEIKKEVKSRSQLSKRDRFNKL